MIKFKITEVINQGKYNLYKFIRSDGSVGSVTEKDYYVMQKVYAAGLYSYVEKRYGSVVGILFTWDDGDPVKAEISENDDLSFKEFLGIEIDKLRYIESEKTGKSMYETSNDLYEYESDEFVNKCAKLYAERYHRQQMRHIENTIPY